MFLQFGIEELNLYWFGLLGPLCQPPRLDGFLGQKLCPVSCLQPYRQEALKNLQLTGGRWSGGLPGLGAHTSVPHRVHQDVGQPGKVLPPGDAEAFSWGGRGHRRGAVDAGGGAAGEEAGAGRARSRVHALPGLGGTRPEAARGEWREVAAPGPSHHCSWGWSEQLCAAP